MTRFRGSHAASLTSPACPALVFCLLVAVLPNHGATAASYDSARPVEAPSPQALVQADRFEKALVLLQSLVQGETVEANTLFLYGLAAVWTAQRDNRTEVEHGALLDEAIATFHAMLIRCRVPAYLTVAPGTLDGDSCRI